MAENTLFNGSTRILAQSLSGLSRRQQLIANNLANADTPGYRPSDLPFERVLDQQVRTAQPLGLAVTSPAHLQATGSSTGQFLSLDRQPAFQIDGNGVDVDSEMSRLSETSIEFDAVAQLLSARIAQFRSAVTEGRR